MVMTGLKREKKKAQKKCGFILSPKIYRVFTMDRHDSNIEENNRQENKRPAILVLRVRKEK